MNLLCIFGTRPEIIKMAPVISAAKKNGHDCYLVHTGQHYSQEMSNEILRDTGIKEDLNLNAADDNFSGRFSKILIGLQNVFEKHKFDFVLSEGDTDSVLAAALGAHKNSIPFGHVEAGLRSFDRNMPEENNRVLTDQISDFLFAPTKWSYNYLLRNSECNIEQVFLTGNTIIDAINKAMKQVKKSTVLAKYSLVENDYVVATIHRMENVDNKERLSSILLSLHDVKTPIIFPLHPRTNRRIEEFGLGKLLTHSNIQTIPPLPYFDFIRLCMGAKYIISDSGGIQEEVTVYKKPVILVRDNTERPEVVGSFVTLVGADQRKISSSISYLENNHESIIEDLKRLESPYGKGDSGEKIIKILERYS